MTCGVVRASRQEAMEPGASAHPYLSGGAFHAHVCGNMRRQAVSVGLPPSLLPGFACQLDEPVTLLLEDAVDLGQVTNVPRRD